MWTLAAVVCVAGLAGCTTGHDLPTVSGAPPSASDLETAAESYYQCMTDAGIKVDLNSNAEGQNVQVTFSMDYHLVEVRDKDGQGHALLVNDDDPDKYKLVQDYNSTAGDPYELILDGTNYSGAYKTCMTESGYDDDAAMKALESPVDPVLLQNQIDSDNRWAQCARDNGWLGLQDVVAPTDATSGMPMVMLPWPVTEDQLSRLLDACPPVDTVNGFATAPLIGFETPTITYDSDGNPDAESQAVLDQVDTLYAMIRDASNAYYFSPSGNPT